MSDAIAWRDVRVVVTGAAGFVGRHLVPRVRALGAEVLPWVRRPTEGARALDLRDPAQVVEGVVFDRPDVVLHLAASGVSHAEAHAAWVIGDNVMMAEHLLDALAVHAPHARLVHTGTMAEYGPKPGGDLAEDDATVPGTAYGIAKLAVGLLLREYAPARRIHAVHARLFGVCGPGECEPRIFPTMLRRLRAGEPVPLLDGVRVRDLVHVEDACEALLRIAVAPGLPSGIAINVGTGIGLSIRECAERLCDELGASRDLLRFGARTPSPGDRERLVADVTRLRSSIGWVPPARLSAPASLVRNLEGES